MDRTILRERPAAFTLYPFLSEAACRGLIERAEGEGFRRATLNRGRQTAMDEDVRNNHRVIFEDRALASDLFRRAEAHLPKLYGYVPVGFNERFRAYRYTPGERFRRHRDGHFERDDGERSRLTVLVYMSEGFEGGETWFPFHTVTPRVGLALFFEHALEHAGVAVTAGTKYVLRSDVMYFPDIYGS